MKSTLNEIAEIRSGIYAKPAVYGDIIYLQGKHFTNTGELKEHLIPELKMDIQKERHLLKEGDILVASKGTKNYATLFHEKMGLAIASSTFIVVGINHEYRSKILPEFLVWTINNPASQEYIKNNAIGTAVQSVSKKVISNLVISIPPIAKQKTILKICQLWDKQKQLKVEINKLYEQQIQQQLLIATELYYK